MMVEEDICFVSKANWLLQCFNITNKMSNYFSINKSLTFSLSLSFQFCGRDTSKP